MRRLATGVLVLGLLALGLAAAVDALRGDATQEPVAAPVGVGSDREDAAAALRAADATGTLTYSDEDCRLHVVRLPDLAPGEAPGYASCEPHIPTGGIGVFKGDVVWSGFGYRAVQVVFSREKLTRALRRLGWAVTGGYRAAQAVPLADGRYAVLAEPEPRLLAFVASGRVTTIVSSFLGKDVVLRQSPTGERVAAVIRRQSRVRIFSPSGSEEPLPDVTRPHAVAWSPDDRWTALATRYSVYVFPSARPDETIRIPLAGVRDLDWGT